MTATLGITRAVTNLSNVEAMLGLRPAADAEFFTEWLGPLPQLSDADKGDLDRLKSQYRYYQDAGAITESTVNLIMVAPLLELLNLNHVQIEAWSFPHRKNSSSRRGQDLLNPPYLVQGEKQVKIEIENGDTLLTGLTDVLVLKDGFWLVLIESKRYGFSVMQARPQTLAYMAGSASKPSFGLITTGEDFLFVKADAARYDFADKLTLTTRRDNQLYTVTQILKKLTRP